MLRRFSEANDLFPILREAFPQGTPRQYTAVISLFELVHLGNLPDLASDDHADFVAIVEWFAQTRADATYSGMGATAAETIVQALAEIEDADLPTPCPNCRTFASTLENAFVVSAVSARATGSSPPPLETLALTVDRLNIDAPLRARMFPPKSELTRIRLYRAGRKWMMRYEGRDSERLAVRPTSFAAKKKGATVLLSVQETLPEVEVYLDPSEGST